MGWLEYLLVFGGGLSKGDSVGVGFRQLFGVGLRVELEDGGCNARCLGVEVMLG